MFVTTTSTSLRIAMSQSRHILGLKTRISELIGSKSHPWRKSLESRTIQNTLPTIWPLTHEISFRTATTLSRPGSLSWMEVLFLYYLPCWIVRLMTVACDMLALPYVLASLTVRSGNWDWCGLHIFCGPVSDSHNDLVRFQLILRLIVKALNWYEDREARKKESPPSSDVLREQVLHFMPYTGTYLIPLLTRCYFDKITSVPYPALGKLDTRKYLCAICESAVYSIAQSQAPRRYDQ